MQPADMRAFKDRAAWRSWLRANSSSADRIWIRFAKKGSGIASVTYDEAVEEALCFGWIDSQIKTVDAKTYRQLYTPRKSSSAWSASNKERVQRMIAAKKMTAAGLAAIETAKKSGSWAASEASERLEVPDDLAAALKKSRAQATFDGFSPSSRRAILAWIYTAKRPETRAARVAKTASMAAKGLRAQIDPEPG